jgi:outer membrane protein TolC
MSKNKKIGNPGSTRHPPAIGLPLISLALGGCAQRGAASFALFNGKGFGATVFAGVTVPLYDGGTRGAMLAQARADADSAEARLTQIRQDAVRQIVLADNALPTGLATREASEALVAAAQTTFDAALAAYRSGVGSITDLTLAQTQLLIARNASADAYSTALSAAAPLALTAGVLGAAPP